jgi:exopolyphosphatase
VTLDDIRTIDPHQTSVFLVDHNVPRGAVADKWDGVEGGLKVEGIIDHHDDEAVFVQQEDHMKRYDVQKSGSCASLVTNWIAGTPPSHPVSNDPTSTTDVPALLRANTPEIHGVAQLLISAILIDTANLTSKVTPHDARAAHFLAQFIPELNLLKPFFDSLRDAKNSIDGLSLPDILRRDYKEYSTPLGKLGMSTVNRPVQCLKDQFASFEEDLRGFIRGRGLCAHVVMTWALSGGEFRRAGMILSERKEVVETFKREGGEKFGMHGVDGIEVAGIVEGWTGWVYEQDALEISRKQVAPFMEEIMKRVGGK